MNDFLLYKLINILKGFFSIIEAFSPLVFFYGGILLLPSMIEGFSWWVKLLIIIGYFCVIFAYTLFLIEREYKNNPRILSKVCDDYTMPGE
jgi:hypothetical protein